jgi:hypothetical protein
MADRFAAALLLCFLGIMWPGRGAAATFTLSNNEVLDGEAIAPNAQGFIVKRPDGSLTPRVAWTNVTENTLKEFARNPKFKPFVEPFVEIEEPDLVKKRVEIKPKPVPRLDRPNPKAGFGAMFSSPLSLTLFLILYAANIYAAYEISVFRNHPTALVCGISAAVPVIGPIVFLCLPTRLQKSHDELAAESMAAHLSEAEQQAFAQAHAQAAPVAAGLAVQGASPDKKQTQIASYQRGQTTFNRRFFETKFAGFLRMVPGDEERNKEIFIRSTRGEHVGQRLSRIMANEVYLQVNKAGATADVIIPFSEIYEVQVRPRQN